MLEPSPAHSGDDDAALRLALAVADGARVDWTEASGTDSDIASSGSVELALQQLERIVGGHRTLYDRLAQPHSQGADTLLTEARRGAASDTVDDLQVHWGPLIVRDKVGHGSFGDVYRAWDPNLEREVALKLVQSTADTQSASDAFEEGRLLARVRHPNVVTVFGVERVQNRVGIWMEFIQGPTLADDLAERGPVAPDEAAVVGVDICHALSAVHDAGLIHRDVKAHNVMRDAHGRVVLGDFGTGRDLQDSNTSEVQLAGTPLYLAPEVLAGQPATVASDQYSVGVLLYHLVTGDYPVRGNTLADVRAAHTRHERKFLAQCVPEVPRTFTNIIDRAIDPDPSRRFETITKLGRALETFRYQPTKTLPDTEVGVPRKTIPSRWVAGFLVASLMVAGAVLTVLRSGSSDGQTNFTPEPSSLAVRLISAGAVPMGPLSPNDRYFGCLDRQSLDLALCELFEGDLRQIRRITHRESSVNDAQYFWGAFSPDGRSVAYVAETHDDIREARIIGVDGAGERLLRRGFDNERFVWLHSWSETNEILAHRTLQDASTEILSVSATDGSTRSLLQSGPEGFGTFQRSPDGRHLAYSRDGDIAVLDLASGLETTLVAHPAYDEAMLWLPNSSAILFLSDRLGTMGLWQVAVDQGRPGGEPTLLRDMGRGGLRPVGFTSDGSLYYWTEVEPWDVFTTNLDSNSTGPMATTRLAKRPLRTSLSPDWSSDGGRVAYLSNSIQSGVSDASVVVQDLTTGRETDLVAGQIDAYQGAKVRWKPDDRALGLLSISVHDYDNRLRVIDPGTGQVLRELNLGQIERQGEVLDFDWLTDDLIVFTRRGQVLLLDVETGVEQTVFASDTATITSIASSPDRARLALTLTDRRDGTTSIAFMPTEGGEPQVVYTALTEDVVTMTSQDWSADGSTIYFTKWDAPDRAFGGTLRLWRIDVDGGVPVPLNLSVPGLRHVAIHPDGRQIAFTTGNRRRDTWVMENLLANSTD